MPYQKIQKNITLILGMWTDKLNKISYLNIKVHYADNFTLKSISIRAEHFPRPLKKVILAKTTMEAIKGFVLEKKYIVAVTVLGSNIASSYLRKADIKKRCSI